MALHLPPLHPRLDEMIQNTLGSVRVQYKGVESSANDIARLLDYRRRLWGYQDGRPDGTKREKYLVISFVFTTQPSTLDTHVLAAIIRDTEQL